MLAVELIPPINKSQLRISAAYAMSMSVIQMNYKDAIKCSPQFAWVLTRISGSKQDVFFA